MKNIFSEIDQLKRQFDQKKPFTQQQIQNLQQHLLIEWTYHSNSIEGNTLTLSETKVILEDGITIGGKTMREHLEAINHKEAILYLEDLVKDKKPLTEYKIKSLHAIILRNIDQAHAGVYRTSKVLISGAKHIPPDPIAVPAEMEQLISWYHGEAKQLHPIERAAVLHSQFVKIHPFIDGNGRTARLLLNLDLMQSGYIPIIIKKEHRSIYYQTLDHAHTTGDPSHFVQFVGEQLKERYQFYLTFFS